MSKQYKIRWKQDDREQLKKATRNFNAKIRRLEKKYDERITKAETYEEKRALLSMKKSLPEKTTIKEMLELINTRQDLKRELNALKRFSQKGAEEIVNVPANQYNLLTTKWQKNEMTRRVGVINRKRKKRLQELAEIELKSRGEKLGYTINDFGMGSYDENELKPLNAFAPTMSRAGLNKKFRVIRKESQSDYWEKRDNLLRENYIKELRTHFGEDAEDIIKAIKKMPFNDFYQIIREEDYDFGHVYYPNKDAYEGHLNSLKVIWLPNKEG